MTSKKRKYLIWYFCYCYYIDSPPSKKAKTKTKNKKKNKSGIGNSPYILGSSKSRIYYNQDQN